MPKHHGKPHKKGIGVKLVGKPDELIRLLVTDPADRKWALDQVINEGPDHKQVHSALLLKRLYTLVKSIEKSTGTSFESQKGAPIVSEHEEEAIPVPLALPAGLRTKAVSIRNVLSHAPGHELVAFGTLLQGLEWAIKAMNRK